MKNTVLLEDVLPSNGWAHLLSIILRLAPEQEEHSCKKEKCNAELVCHEFFYDKICV